MAGTKARSSMKNTLCASQLPVDFFEERCRSVLFVELDILLTELFEIEGCWVIACVVSTYDLCFCAV